MRLFARALIVSGLLLIAVWGVARVHSEVASQSAVATFAATGTIQDATVDTSLWSNERILAFRKSLGLVGDPPIVVLTVPRIGMEVPVFPGTDDLTLNRGAGWIAGTAEPGTNGNSGIAAHRDGFFRALKDIRVGDEIVLRTRSGDQTFSVRSVSIVDPSRVDVLAPSTDAALTLVTCYPFYFAGSAPQRFIVHARRTEAAAAMGNGK